VKGLNKAYLIGHIGQDPELRTTAGGKQILKVSLATPNARKVGDQWVETPDWHRITLWDKSAEFVATYAHKGDVLAVECAIRPGKWTDKDNVVHYEVNLVVDRVLWLNGKHRATSDGAGNGEADLAGIGRRPEPPAAQEEGEEIPF
jgi:single-strand DNA-binding protein